MDERGEGREREREGGEGQSCHNKAPLGVRPKDGIRKQLLVTLSPTLSPLVYTTG